MRLLLLNLLAVSSYAVVFWPLTPADRAVQEYLQLTDRQLAAIGEIQARNATAPLYARRAELQEEIFAETARSPLRQLELGRLYVEFEIIRRRLSDIDTILAVETRRVLTAPQLTKLQALEAAAALGDATSGARSLGLTASKCEPGVSSFLYATFLFPAVSTSIRAYPQPGFCDGPPFPLLSDIPAWGIRPEDRLTQFDGLVRYLGLSQAQQNQIDANRRGAFDSRQMERMARVRDEILEETKRDPLDPQALGQRYAEIETLRRIQSLGEHQANLLNVALLSPEQRVKLAALEEAFRLRPVVNEAQSDLLIRTRCTQHFYLGELPTGLGPSFISSIYLGDCPDRRALEELP